MALKLSCLVIVALIINGPLTSTFAQKDVADEYTCPGMNRWSMMLVQTFSEELTPPLCYMVAEAMTFHRAMSHCHSRQASVFTMEQPYFRYMTATSPTAFLVDLFAKNNVTTMWNGLYVQDDAFRMDSFPMTRMRSEQFERDVSLLMPWERDEKFDKIEPSGMSDCFELDIKVSFIKHCENEEVPSRRKRFVHRLTKRETEIGNDGQCARRSAEVRSRPCGDQLPFVCIKTAVRKSDIVLSRLNTLCQLDEFGNYHDNRCISYGYDPDGVDRLTAEAMCQAMGNGIPGIRENPVPLKRPRTLYREDENDCSSCMNDGIVRAVALYFDATRNNVSLTTSLAWVAREGRGKGDCRALSLGSQNIVSWDCSARLPFYICQQNFNFPGISSFDIKVTLPDFPNLKRSGIAGTADTEVSVPYNSIQEFSRNKPEISCTYNSPVVPNLQSVTLVRRGIPLAEFFPNENQRFSEREGFTITGVTTAFAREEVATQLMNAQDFSEGQQRPMSTGNATDYYWCEVNDLVKGTIHQSARIFVRTLEEEVYAVSIVMNTKPSGRPQLLLDSLLGHPEGQSQQDARLTFQDYRYRILRYRPQLFPMGSNKTIVDFHFFNKTLSFTEHNPSNESLRKAQKSIRANFLNLQRANGSLVKSFNFDLGTLEIKSIDICPNITVYDPVTDKNYYIPDTPLGAVYASVEMCLANGAPYVTLKCKGDKLYGASWSKFKPNNGCDFDDENNSPVTDTLQDISKSDINGQSVGEVLNETADVVSDTDTLKPVDVVYIADIVQKTSEVDNVTVDTGKKLLEIVDKVGNSDKDTLEDSNKLGNATNRIIRAIDDLGDKIVLDDAPNVRVVTDTTALEVWNLTKVQGDVIIGLELRLDEEKPMPVLDTNDLVSLFESSQPMYRETDAAVLLPGKFVRGIQDDNPGSDIRLSMTVFAQTSLFQLGQLESSAYPSTSRNTVLNSKVISAKVTIDGRPVSDLSSSVVTTVYLPIVAVPIDVRAQNTTCVFWKFSGANGQGAWSDEGCRYNRTLEGRDVCVCDHLTNFAVLLDVYGQDTLPQKHQTALSVISIVGLSLSIAGLSITVLSFLLIKKLRQGKPQQTLFNMALAMLASWVVFLAGFNRVESHVGCLVVAVLLHYFILASFMWMLMEGVLQYLLFVKVLGNDFHNYMVKTAIPAWGIPLIPVVVVLAIDTEMYKGGDQYCWMSLTPFYYAFLAPVALVMVTNVIVYIMVIVNICRRSNKGIGSSNKNGVGIRASVACFIILGLSWIFAFFAVEDARVVFQYLFTITTSLQGLLIFLVFTARDPLVRAFWKQTCCRGKVPDKSSTNATPYRLNHGNTHPQKLAGSQDAGSSPSNLQNGSSTGNESGSNRTSTTSMQTGSSCSQPVAFSNNAFEETG